MTAIPGTNIADKIVPFDTNDSYATHDEKYGKGGWRSVQSITERDLIPFDRRTERMVVNILDSGQVYQLKNGISNSNWESFTIDVSGSDISINNIGPDVNGNFNIIGSSSILISSNPLTNTILISAAPTPKTYLIPGFGIGINEDVENTYTVSVTGSFGDVTLRSEVEAVTGNLQSQIFLQSNAINDIYSTYTNSATTQAISAGLNDRISSLELSTLGEISKVEVAAISAGLDSRINSNELVDAQQTNSINTLFSTYTNSATTQAISAGLDSRIVEMSGTYATKQDVYNLDIDLQQQIFYNVNSINTLYSTYTNSTTTAAISAGIISQIPINKQGMLLLNTTNILYTIPHVTLASLAEGYPIVTLQVPSSASNLMVVAVTNRTLSSFDVVLSQSPNTSGYYVYWSIAG